VGSEGTLGVITRAVVRILRRPERVQTFLAAFDSIDAAGEAVSAIIAAGIIPAAIEMMDALAIRAAEAAVHPGFPPADTILIVELDGPAAEVAALSGVVVDICKRLHASPVEVATDESHRARIWRGRKAAFHPVHHLRPRSGVPFPLGGGLQGDRLVRLLVGDDLSWRAHHRLHL
jgi:glycolate oxidase